MVDLPAQELRIGTVTIKARIPQLNEQRRRKIDLVQTFRRYHTYQQCCGSGMFIPDPGSRVK
jgi:hypothetical protein